ncbi:hypothetical protein A6A19_02675 [Actinobacillus delphinicola]|nr:DUF2726 domain-containing protein [Actinobacillus delphinicola]MDG6896929.1 hypothetical protein [Actinobacillus delphinicola]
MYIFKELTREIYHLHPIHALMIGGITSLIFYSLIKCLFHFIYPKKIQKEIIYKPQIIREEKIVYIEKKEKRPFENKLDIYSYNNFFEKKPILTRNEQYFYITLCRLCREIKYHYEEDFFLLAQVPFIEIIKPKHFIPKEDYAKFFHLNKKIALENENEYQWEIQLKNSLMKTAQRVDFILADSSLNPLLIIELDDPSHENNLLNDTKRDLLFKNAGIPTLRFCYDGTSENIPTFTEISSRIMPYLGLQDEN